MLISDVSLKNQAPMFARFVYEMKYLEINLRVTYFVETSGKRHPSDISLTHVTSTNKVIFDF